jgi:hypothetical protein
MCTEPLGTLFVELGHRAGIPTGMLGVAGGHGVAQLFLDRAGRNEAGGDAPGIRLLADPGVERHHVRGRDEPRRLDGDQLGVTGPDADAVELC